MQRNFIPCGPVVLCGNYALSSWEQVCGEACFDAWIIVDVLSIPLHLVSFKVSPRSAYSLPAATPRTGIVWT